MSSTEKKEDNERMTSEEFKQVLPYLPPEEWLIVQFKNKHDEWRKVFWVTKKGKNKFDSMTCEACVKYFSSSEFISHLKSKNHKDTIKDIKHFYHPIFTYRKCDVKLAKGESVSLAAKKEAITKSEKEEASIEVQTEYNHTRYLFEHFERPSDKRNQNALSSLVLNNPVTKPEQMFAEVIMPMKYLLQTEFKPKDSDTYQKLLIKNGPKGYDCNLCKKFCSSALMVTSHFNGFSHKVSQLDISSMHNNIFKHLTKYCIYNCGSTYSFKIRQDANEFYKEKLYDRGEDKKTIDAELPAKIVDKFKARLKHIPSNTQVDEKEEKINQEGLIGVEYVVKLTNDLEDDKCLFECLLCRKDTVRSARMQGHLISTNHRLNYLDEHYTDTIGKYRKKVNNNLKEMRVIAAKLAKAIEEKHGRSLCFPTSADTYRQKRPEIIEFLHRLKHASQIEGPSFSNLISDDELEKLKEIRNSTELFVPDYVKANFLNIPSSKPYMNTKHHSYKFWDTERLGPFHKQSAINDKTSGRDREMDTNGRRENIRKSSRPTDIWQQYRDMVSKEAIQIEADYMKFRNYPESHPQYEPEWNQFWKLRKLELQQQGINYKNYDFQPEWICFFKQRLEELFSAELNGTGVEVRKRLNIPLDAEEDSDFMNNSDRRDRRQREKRIRSSSVEISDDWRGQRDDSRYASKRHHFESRHDRRSRDRSPFGLRDRSPKRRSDSYHNIHGSTETFPDPVSTTFDDKANVINVLRMLTALEDQLGSLGPKILNLLSQSLMLERNISPDNIIELEKQILTPSNCTLLETAMEKLKGIIFAGLLDQGKIKGFNRVIQHTGDILRYAEKMGWRNNVQQMPKSNQQSLSSSLEAMMSKQSSRSVGNNVVSQQNPHSYNRSGGDNSQFYNATNNRQQQQPNQQLFNRPAMNNYNNNMGNNMNSQGLNNSYPPQNFNRNNNAVSGSGNGFGPNGSGFDLASRSNTAANNAMMNRGNLNPVNVSNTARFGPDSNWRPFQQTNQMNFR